MGSGKNESKPTIECAKDGPLLVNGLENLSDSKGQDVPTKHVMALCRCGGSGNKPFCDGTHGKIGFTSEKLTGRTPDRREKCVGKRITIHDNLVFSGPTHGYYDGIFLNRATSLATRTGITRVCRFGLCSFQWVNRAELYNNETCGTEVPLSAPAGLTVAEVDGGGNRWESCRNGTR